VGTLAKRWNDRAIIQKDFPEVVVRNVPLGQMQNPLALTKRPWEAAKSNYRLALKIQQLTQAGFIDRDAVTAKLDEISGREDAEGIRAQEHVSRAAAELKVEALVARGFSWEKSWRALDATYVRGILKGEHLAAAMKHIKDLA